MRRFSFISGAVSLFCLLCWLAPYDFNGKDWIFVLAVGVLSLWIALIRNRVLCVSLAFPAAVALCVYDPRACVFAAPALGGLLCYRAAVLENRNTARDQDLFYWLCLVLQIGACAAAGFIGVGTVLNSQSSISFPLVPILLTLAQAGLFFLLILRTTKRAEGREKKKGEKASSPAAKKLRTTLSCAYLGLIGPVCCYLTAFEDYRAMFCSCLIFAMALLLWENPFVSLRPFTSK